MSVGYYGKKLNFWHRVLLASVMTTLLVGLFSSVYYDMTWAARYTAVGLWAVVNFWLLGWAIQLVATRKSLWLLQLLVVLKIPGWYFVGYLIIQYLGFDLSSFLVGFNTFFIVLILKTLGLQFDKTEQQELNIG